MQGETWTSTPRCAFRQISNTSYSSATLAYWKPDNYTIELRARGVKSGETLAEARCILDRRGVVLIQDATAPNYAVTVEAAATTP